MGDLARLSRSMVRHELGKTKAALADFREAEKRFLPVPEFGTVEYYKKNLQTIAYMQAREALGIEEDMTQKPEQTND